MKHVLHGRFSTFRTMVICLIVCAGATVAQDRHVMRVDGVFDDWKTSDTIAKDPAGDATGALDITRLDAKGEGGVLYVHFALSKAIKVQSGEEREGTLVFRVQVSRRKAILLDMRAKRAWVERNPAILNWTRVGYLIAPSFESKQYEWQINLSAWGVKEGSELTISVAGSDAVKPCTVTMGPASKQWSERPVARADDTSFRIASLNSLRSGLSDPQRSPILGRLLAASQGDVLCLQEVWNTNDIKKAIEQNVGGSWHVNGPPLRGCLIASKHPLETIKAPLKHSSVALVRLPKAPLLVINTHPPHAAKGEPARVAEMTRIAAFIASWRSGTFDKNLQADRNAAVICVGDWNLVGTRKPLDILEAKDGPRLAEWLLPHAVGESTATWRSLEDLKGETAGGYAPGRLDVLTFSPQALKKQRGFILDSTQLSEKTLKRLGLKKDDSLASDHLMLVAGFTFVGGSSKAGADPLDKR